MVNKWQTTPDTVLLFHPCRSMRRAHANTQQLNAFAIVNPFPTGCSPLLSGPPGSQDNPRWGAFEQSTACHAHHNAGVSENNLAPTMMHIGTGNASAIQTERKHAIRLVRWLPQLFSRTKGSVSQDGQQRSNICAMVKIFGANSVSMVQSRVQLLAIELKKALLDYCHGCSGRVLHSLLVQMQNNPLIRVGM